MSARKILIDSDVILDLFIERDYPTGEVEIVTPTDFMRLDAAEKAT